MKLFRVTLLVLLFASIASAQTIPPVKAKTLNDAEVTLPDPSGPPILILVVGFSHKSSELTKVWTKQISANFHDNKCVAYYQMPNLQGVPGFVKPMILSGMHKDVPAGEQPHFVPIYDHKDEWKKLVGYSSPDDAYLLVATSDGHPVWQAHGSYSEATYHELKKSVSALLDKTADSTPKH